jgi:hypothetical protein
MRVSQNEVYRTARRALEAAGAAYGVDRDGAHAVAWLAAHGLPGPALLAASLDLMDGAFAPLSPPRRVPGTPTIDLGGRPAVAWAAALIDCLDLAQRAGMERLRLRACRWPLFLLPAALRYAERGRAIQLRWNAGAAVVICGLDSASGCRIVVEDGPADLGSLFLNSAPVAVVLDAAGRNSRAGERAAKVQLVDAAALDAALTRSLSEGIEVDAAIWARIAGAAQLVLVPASEESRTRGAGGGDANA